ncbi:MAG: GAF domain-containing sensor histidine kinase, partial [Anaerolineae bacterium]|nr:GAF domain-containing sensor histidine kinase [Anaerolineae bacterium]
QAKITPGEDSQGDPLQLIASHFDKMNAELLQARENVQFQRKGFTALLGLFESFDEKSTIQDLFQLSVYTIRNITGWSSVAMRLYDSKRETFDLLAQYGMTPKMVEELKSIPVTRGFQHKAFLTKKPVYSSHLAGDPRLGGSSPVEVGYQSLVCIPLLAADRVVGSVELASKEFRNLHEDELRWLELVGRSVGNLFSLVQMTDKLKSLAVIQERTRLSQEIHDGLAQLIGSLRMWAEDIQDAVKDGDTESIQYNAEKIEQTARDAYASLREEMLELRDSSNSGKDLLPVLTEYLDRFQRQSGIQTRLVIDRDISNMGALMLSTPGEIQLLRIIQEAVTNVRRHANADHVIVSLARDNNWLKVSIQDNGIGFDYENIAEDRLGLRIMRERAASIQGNIKVESSPGSGTEITVLMPMLTVRREKNE